MNRKIAIGLIITLMLTMMPMVSYGSEVKAQGNQVEYVLSTTGNLYELSLPSYVVDITYADHQLALVCLPSEAYVSDFEQKLTKQMPEILVEPNFVYEETGYADPYYGEQWGLKNTSTGIDVNFEPAESLIKANKSQLKETIVAVIDSGFDHSHSDLAGNVWINKKEIKGNKKDDDKNGYVDDVYGYNFASDKPLVARPQSADYSHGTHCAGVIGAVSDNGVGITGIASVSEKVKLMNLRVLANGEGSTFDVIRAIKYAESKGASICNLSLGSYDEDKLLYTAMKKSKMLFVCAAGNGNNMGGSGYNLNYKPVYPGSYSRYLTNVICVGNIQSNGSLHLTSNYSDRAVDLAAPGTYIYSTIPAESYAKYTGTSMATPFVTGAAALLRSYYYGISPAEIKKLLKDSVTVYPTLSGKTSTSGYLNIYRALTAMPMDYYAPDETAPELTAEVSPIEDNYRQGISIKATDDSGTVQTVKYARGIKSAAYFKKKGYGYLVKLDADGNGFKTCGVPGPYSVYATDSAGNSTVVTVECTSDAPSTIKLNYTKRILAKGKSFTLKATLSKSGTYGRNLTYTSSNKKIATVNSKGKVVAKKKGVAYITVKTGNLLTMKCKVTVK